MCASIMLNIRTISLSSCLYTITQLPIVSRDLDFNSFLLVQKYVIFFKSEASSNKETSEKSEK